MLTGQEALARLASSPDGKTAALHGERVGDLNLRGHVFEQPVCFAGALFQGQVDLSEAVFRGPATFEGCTFHGPAQLRDCRFERGAAFSLARFESNVDFYRASFAGSAWFWRTYFGGDAMFTEAQSRGELNFSWARFEGKSVFSFLMVQRPAYFYRTLFRRDVMMDDCVFKGDVLFCGKRTEVLFPRFGVLDYRIVGMLEQRGLFRPDTEMYQVRDGERLSTFVLFANVLSREDLVEKLDRLDVPLTSSDREALERHWQEGAKRMFAPGTVLSFRGTAFANLDRVKFEKVDLTEMTVDTSVVGPQEVEETLRANMMRNSFDVFVSHASDDKASLVRPLVDALRRLGLVVWYDEDGIRVGQSLRGAIDEGLARSRFGVVIVSRSFLGRRWTEYELDSMLARGGPTGPRIFPVWFGVKQEEIAQRLPKIADLRALTLDADNALEPTSLEALALELARSMQ